MGSRKMSLAEQFPHIQNIVDAQGLYTLMQDYLIWLRERNYSEQTIAGRELFLCGLIDWCEQRTCAARVKSPNRYWSATSAIYPCTVNPVVNRSHSAANTIALWLYAPGLNGWRGKT
jgi:hypothetical protein